MQILEHSVMNGAKVPKKESFEALLDYGKSLFRLGIDAHLNKWPAPAFRGTPRKILLKEYGNEHSLPHSCRM
jgi:hypothetical protein